MEILVTLNSGGKKQTGRQLHELLLQLRNFGLASVRRTLAETKGATTRLAPVYRRQEFEEKKTTWKNRTSGGQDKKNGALRASRLSY